MALRQVTDQTFEQEVLKHDGPVLVDFWAPWCGPCRQVTPALEALAAEHGDRLKIVKLNIDEEPVTTDRYDVMSVPTLMLFQDGQPGKTIQGPRPKLVLEREFLG